MTKREIPVSELVQGALSGENFAIARLLTLTEESLESASRVLSAVSDLPRRGIVVGFTGSPGAGKSTLIAVLASRLAIEDHRVAIVANDPTGYRTGGALLGDRIRMLDLARNQRVFIRSVASRDPLRSLNAATYSSVDLLARVGFDFILIETVGTGQSDIATSHVADATVLVLSPDNGDDVQTMKSGVMEVADTIVLNKCDIASADRTLRMLRDSLAISNRHSGRTVPVIAVSALERSGIDELMSVLKELESRDVDSNRANVVELLLDLVSYEVARRLRENLPGSVEMAQKVDAIADSEIDVLTAALDLVKGFLATSNRVSKTHQTDRGSYSDVIGSAATKD
jgi:LAO/AO transport system kinase